VKVIDGIGIVVVVGTINPDDDGVVGSGGGGGGGRWRGVDWSASQSRNSFLIILFCTRDVKGG